jgi:hypothetical protein
VDLESRNGTFVGEERITEARLVDGASLRFGRTQAQFALRPTWSRALRAPRDDRGRGEPQRDTIRAERTHSTRARSAREPEADPYALALRPAVLLRMSLHAIGLAGSPDAAARVRAAVEAAAGAALDEGAAVGRLASVGVLAVFGLTSPAPDDAVRAVRVARVARATVRRLGGIDLRAAIDAGPILAGNAGAELAALGAAADRCERLAALAHAGDIVVGPGAAGGAPSADATRTELDGIAVEILRDD